MLAIKLQSDTVCKNIGSIFSLDVLSYMQDIAVPTKVLGIAEPVTL